MSIARNGGGLQLWAGLKRIAGKVSIEMQDAQRSISIHIYTLDKK
jgi:hypothetical protein